MNHSLSNIPRSSKISNILSIAMYDLKMTIRDRAAFMMVLIMPIFMIFLMGTALKDVFEPNQDIKRIPVLYANEDQGDIGKSFDVFIKSQDGKLLDIIPAESDQIKSGGALGETRAAIIVPKGLSHRTEQGEKVSIQVISSGKDTIEPSIIRSLVSAFIGSTSTRLGIMKRYYAYLPSAPSSEIMGILDDIQSRYDGNFTCFRQIERFPGSQLTSFQFFAASMLVFFLLTTGMGLSSSIIGERVNKTYMRIFSLPITQNQYLLGKILSSAAVAILQSLFVVIFARTLFNVNWGSNWAGLGITILLLIFISCALGIIFASIMNSVKAQTTAMTVLFWIMTFISGGFTASPVLGSAAEKLTVNKWAFDSLTGFIQGADPKDVAVPLLVLSGISLVLWTTGLILYKRRVHFE